MTDLAAVSAEVAWLLLWTVLCVAIGVVATARSVSKLGRPWELWIAPMGVAVAPTLLSIPIWLNHDTSPESLRVRALSFGALRLMVWFTVLPALGLGMLVSAARAGRPAKSRAVVVAVAVGWLAAATVWAGGWLMGDPVFSGVRALTIALAAAVAGWGVGARGPLGAHVATALPLVVALGEASYRGIATMLIVLQTKAMTSELWPAAVAAMLDVLTPSVWAAHAALLCASGVAMWSGWRTDDRAVMGAATLCVTLSWAIWGAADYGVDRLEALAVLTSR